MMITDAQILGRLLLAALLGALIGLDRERQNQPAGLRTHIILVTGSALAMTLSINLAINYKGIATNGDPSRLAAQVLSGIGFLGAGAILRYGSNIKGLTTATSLWTMAVVGLAVGAGYVIVSVGATVFLLGALTLLRRFERSKIDSNIVRHILITGEFRPEIEARLVEVLKEKTLSFSISRMERSLRKNRLRITIIVKIKSAENLSLLLEQISAIKGLVNVRIE